MVKINQAVILAGGEGKRLRPFTLKNPKPMISINGKPFLWHLIELLKKNYIKEVVILTGYLSDKIEKYFGDGINFGIKIKYSHTPFLDKNGQENESGLRLKNAQNLLDDFFLLLYCDNYYPLNLKKLISYFKERECDALITAFSNLDNSTKNNIYIDKDGYVKKYDPERVKKNLNGVDMGFFLINKKVLNLLPKSSSRFESNLLPKLIKKRKLAGFLTDQKYYSIGDVKRIKITKKFLTPKKVIFLDRDGVINKQPPKADYVKVWEEFEFLPGAIQAIKLLNQRGYKVYVISNQPGIGRGLMSEKDLENICKNMLKVLKKHGAEINGIYYCPHKWDEGCSCRKPAPGMFFRASREHFINLTKTIFVGDHKRDMQAGKAAGCRTILVNAKKNLYQIASDVVK